MWQGFKKMSLLFMDIETSMLLLNSFIFP